MNIEEFKKNLTDKGYTDYMAGMLSKMFEDLQNRSKELSLLTGLEIITDIVE